MIQKDLLWLFWGKCIRDVEGGGSYPGSNENEGCMIGDLVVITIFHLFNNLI